MTGIPTLGRFAGVLAEHMGPAQVELADAFVSRRGSIPGPYKIWLSNPSFVARQKNLSDYLLRGGALSNRECEIAILVTARRLKAAFVEVAHRRIAAAAGLEPSIIEGICNGTTPQFDNERERMVYEATCAMHDDRPASKELFDRAVAVLGHGGLSELAGLLGFYCACCFTLSFYAAEAP